MTYITEQRVCHLCTAQGTNKPLTQRWGHLCHGSLLAHIDFHATYIYRTMLFYYAK
jgi:hypothetical protein